MFEDIKDKEAKKSPLMGIFNHAAKYFSKKKH